MDRVTLGPARELFSTSVLGPWLARLGYVGAAVIATGVASRVRTGVADQPFVGAGVPVAVAPGLEATTTPSRGPLPFLGATDVGRSAGQCVTSPVPPQPGSDERGRDEEKREERDDGEVVDRDCGQVRER